MLIAHLFKPAPCTDRINYSIVLLMHVHEITMDIKWNRLTRLRALHQFNALNANLYRIQWNHLQPVDLNRKHEKKNSNQLKIQKFTTTFQIPNKFSIQCVHIWEWILNMFHRFILIVWNIACIPLLLQHYLLFIIVFNVISERVICRIWN